MRGNRETQIIFSNYKLLGLDGRPHEILTKVIFDGEQNDDGRYMCGPSYRTYIDGYLYVVSGNYHAAQSNFDDATSAVLDGYLELNRSEVTPE